MHCVHGRAEWCPANITIQFPSNVCVCTCDYSVKVVVNHDLGVNA